MNRRGLCLLALVLVTLGVASPESLAQGPARMPRVGVLMGAVVDGSPRIDAFRRGLGEMGYIEGKNVTIEWRWARGEAAQASELADELVRLKVDVIVASSGAIAAAQAATKTIPIVMVHPSDPVAVGLIASLARPGGNLTGLTAQLAGLDSKRVQLLREAVPGLSRAAALFDPGTPAIRKRIKEADTAAVGLGLRFDVVNARDAAEFETAFAMMARTKVGAVFFPGSAMHYTHRARIAALAVKSRLPTVCSARDYAEAGCLMSYGADVPDLYRRAPSFVDKILKGAKAGQLPVEQPTKFEMVINRKTARALGLTVPASLLLRADHLID